MVPSTSPSTISSFLAKEEMHVVESAFAKNLLAFRSSEIVGRRLETGRAERRIRSSQYLIAPDAVRCMFVRKLRQHLGQVGSALGWEWDEPASIDVEVQMTISQSGDFFRRHNDSTDAMKPSRKLTYVHYAHREPRQFSGGELIVEAPDQEIVIVPKRNMLVIFPSIWKHEVRLVSGRATNPLDWRLTVNGWIHE